MTQQDKDLLIKDLCARLPYGVRGTDYYFDEPYSSEVVTGFIEEDGDYKVHYADENYIFIKDFKLILFPLSVIYQKIEVNGKEMCVAKIIYEHLPHTIIINENISWLGACIPNYTINQMETLFSIFHRYHIDYRDLIGKGLAISVFDLPENPYK